MLFGVSDEIQDITRRSGMVRRIRFIYGKSNSKFGKSPVIFGKFWKVLELSGKFHYGRWSPGRTPPALAGPREGRWSPRRTPPSLAGHPKGKGEESHPKPSWTRF